MFRPESFEARLQNFVLEHIRKEYDLAVDRIVAEAQQKLGEQIRDLAAKTAVRLSEYISMEQLGNVLRIEIQIKEKK
jgi:hypothetical protein